jgi:hypothetical protein
MVSPIPGVLVFYVRSSTWWEPTWVNRKNQIDETSTIAVTTSPVILLLDSSEFGLGRAETPDKATRMDAESVRSERKGVNQKN